METYSPHASYAILEQHGSGWDAAFVKVAYDHEAAAAQARAHGREDWARCLASGRV
jgi:hypothetical protein